MADAETPTEIVLKMQKEGKSDAEIVATLTERGLKPAQISEALNQARIKQAVEARAAEKAKATERAKVRETEQRGLAPSILTTKEGEVETPSAPIEEVGPEVVTPREAEYPYEEYVEAVPAEATDTEIIEEIAEEIISEKWEEAKAKISSLVEWKDYAESRLKNIDERMRRIESALDKMQAALLTETRKYGQTIKDLGTEMQSLEGAFSKILSPLATNIKELQRITGKLKPKSKGKRKEKRRRKR